MSFNEGQLHVLKNVMWKWPKVQVLNGQLVSHLWNNYRIYHNVKVRKSTKHKKRDKYVPGSKLKCLLTGQLTLHLLHWSPAVNKYLPCEWHGLCNEVNVTLTWCITDSNLLGRLYLTQIILFKVRKALICNFSVCLSVKLLPQNQSEL